MSGLAGFSCPGCAGSTARPYLAFRRGAIAECAGCGLLSTWPRVDAETAQRRYSDAYYAGGSASRFRVPAADRIMQQFRRRRARALANALGGVTGKRILDVGCGRGHTLLALRRMGADVFGTQLSAPAARAAAGLLGADRVFIGELEHAGYGPASFDAVTLWHVLEHVREPFRVLTQIARILKPDGLLYVEVPNAGGWTARSYGVDWLAYDIAHHVSHFTPATLTALARRAGLTVAREVHLSIEYSPVTLAQTWLNRWLGGDSRLFRAVTHDEDPDAPRGRVPLVFHVVALGALLPVAVVVSLWLAHRGAGDTYGVYLLWQGGGSENRV